MDRLIRPELLDQLPAADLRALRSRRDIVRLNALMGNADLVAGALQHAFPRHLFIRLADLGSGSGQFLLQIARRLRGRWRGVDATLLDRHLLLEDETREQFEGMKWQTQTVAEDVFQWLQSGAANRFEVFVTSLFLHQFENDRLRELLALAAERTRFFVAVEPRRSLPALWLSRCVGLIGCNAVTRHDAPASVRAGFAGRELSALWPDTENWDLTEHRGRWFSHVFVARRKDRVESGIFQPIVSAVFDRPARSPRPTKWAPAAGLSRHGGIGPESAPRPEI